MMLMMLLMKVKVRAAGHSYMDGCGISMLPVAVAGPLWVPDLQLTAVAMVTAVRVTDDRAAMVFQQP